MALHTLSISQACRVTLMWLLIAQWLLPAPRALALESTLLVTTAEDLVDGDTASANALRADPGPDGAIALREAIIAANATPGSDTVRIAFAIAATDPSYDATSQTWRLPILTNALPPLTRNAIVIDGDTTAATTPAIILDGFDVYFPEGALVGLTLRAAESTLRGLAIINFYDAAVVIAGAAALDNRVEASWLGLNPRGAVELPAFSGIELRDGATGNTVGGTPRNLIGGSTEYGVRISGSTTRDTLVAGNWIGVGPDGQSSAANQIAGVLIERGASGNQIGRATRGNVIAGNTIGVKIDDAPGNIVAGNLIGLRPDGTAALPNTDGGIFLVNTADDNQIGGTISGAGNIIAGNGSAATTYGQGLYLADSHRNRVQGNLFGTASDGLSAIGNTSHGILVLGTASENQIGGTAAGAANIIAYSGSSGIRIDVGAANNIVSGNSIGVAADGVTPLANQQHGVLLDGDANIVGPANRIMYNNRSGVLTRGTTSTVRENIIGANARSGVCITGSAAQLLQNILSDNGTAADPFAVGCLSGSGVVISSTVQALVSGNTIDNNDEYGIAVVGGRTNQLLGNSIRRNMRGGIVLSGGANDAISAPVITSATTATAAGRGCAACHVELFADTADQGEIFLGTTVAAADGTFQITFATEPAAPFLTATNTDAAGNTSPFAAAAQVGPPATDPTPTTPTPPVTVFPTPAREKIFLPSLRATR